ncbi:hypothetical protein [Fibrella arboris]
MPQQTKYDLEARGITSIATVADINGGLDWQAYGEFIAVADD